MSGMPFFLIGDNSGLIGEVAKRFFGLASSDRRQLSQAFQAGAQSLQSAARERLSRGESAFRPLVIVFSCFAEEIADLAEHQFLGFQILGV